MTFIVEDGTGIANANSYISVTDADAYHALFDNTDWSGETADKEQALILATKSLDLLYGPRFLSYKRHTNNVLQFPRYVFYDNNMQVVDTYTIPFCVKDAVCEIALLVQQGVDIYPLPNLNNNVKLERTKIGDLEIEKQYTGTMGNTESFASFRKIDLQLWPVLKKDKQSNISFVR